MSWADDAVDSEAAVPIAAGAGQYPGEPGVHASLGLTESSRRPVQEGSPRFTEEMTDAER